MTVETQKTKRYNTLVELTPLQNEREFRDSLAKKVSGICEGLWLLVPEYLRLGAWEILKGWTGDTPCDIETRIAMQLVNESAMCVHRVREKKLAGAPGISACQWNGQACYRSTGTPHAG